MRAIAKATPRAFAPRIVTGSGIGEPGAYGLPHAPGSRELLQDPLVPAVQQRSAILRPPLLVAQQQVGQDLW